MKKRYLFLFLLTTFTHQAFSSNNIEPVDEEPRSPIQPCIVKASSYAAEEGIGASTSSNVDKEVMSDVKRVADALRATDTALFNPVQRDLESRDSESCDIAKAHTPLVVVDIFSEISTIALEKAAALEAEICEMRRHMAGPPPRCREFKERAFTRVDLEKLSQSLETLTFSNCAFEKTSDVALLPQGLETLTFSHCTFEKDADLTDLPQGREFLKNLKTLTFVNCIFETADLAYLPRGLENLTLKECCPATEKNFYNFPPKLGSLSLSGCAEMTDKDLQSLPRTLCVLNILGCPKITDQGLQYLPSTLKWLVLDASSGEHERGRLKIAGENSLKRG